jgi:hypothetical protein
MSSAVAPSVTTTVVAKPAVMTRGRRLTVWTLIVVATLLALVSILTVWVNRQMLDNNSWKNASAQVIQDPKVRASLAAFMVNELYDNVNVEQALAGRLPANLKQLAGPLASALRQPATNTAAAILARPRVQQLWVTTLGIAHQKLINVLENKTGFGIQTGNGVVTVNLHELVTELGTQLGIPASALARIPATTGVIPVMRSDQLASAQKGVRLIKILSAWLLILVFALYALAVYLARGARRVILRDVGWTLVVLGVIVLLIRRLAGNYTLDALSSPTYEGTLRHVWLIETSIWGQIGIAAIIYGVVVVLAAVLAGRMRWAVAARRLLAPVFAVHTGVAALVVAVAYLLVVLWGPTHALRQWWGILIFAGLIAVGFALLRRQTLAEFAPTGAAVASSVPAGPRAPEL